MDVPAAEKSMRAVVRVQEVRPYRVQYGGFYDTERGPGLIADFTNRNTVGNAATLGIRGRYDNEIREIRAYYSQPQLGGLPFDTNIATFLSRDIRKTRISSSIAPAFLCNSRRSSETSLFSRTAIGSSVIIAMTSAPIRSLT